MKTRQVIKRLKDRCSPELLAILDECEVEGNLATAKVMYAVAGVYFLSSVLAFLKVFSAGEKLAGILFYIGLAIVSISILTVKKGGKGKGLKYALIGFFLVSVFIVNVLIGYKAWIMFGLPIFFTCRYYNRRFTTIMGVVAMAMAVASAFANAYFSPFTTLIDLNTVSFSEPGNLSYYGWLFNAVMKHGYDKALVLRNTLRLSTLPNCLSIILIVLGCNSHIVHAQKILLELKMAEDAAEKANAAKTTFLFDMSHDIRTPMNAILGYTELMKRYSGDKEKFDDYIEKVRTSGVFLLSLINKVLEMAKIENGNLTLDEEPCDILAVAEGTNAIYSELMTQKDIEYSFDHDTTHKYYYCDKLKVGEVFLNLLSNAYKYTPEGGRVSVTMREKPHEDPAWIYIVTTISDTGIGMSSDFLPTIFDEFSRARNTTDSRIEGTGLGMPIVKKLVDLMGGTIEVSSDVGKGTTFVVTIPHRIAEAMDVKKGEEDSSSSLDILEGKRILLAEDNDLNAEIAIEVLKFHGILAERASDGIECVDMVAKAEEGYYDAILMDIQMPNLNGFEATSRIRALSDPGKASLPIIAMTANAFEEDRKNALAAGMNAHLAKPIEVPKLVEVLASVLKS